MQPSTWIAREDPSAIGSVNGDSCVLWVPLGVEGEGDCGVLLAGDLSPEDGSRPEADAEDRSLPGEGAFSCARREVLGRM